MIKFGWDNPDGMEIGLEVLKNAVAIFMDKKQEGKTKIEAVEEAMRKYRSRKDIPTDDSLVDAITEILELKEANRLKTGGQRSTARTAIINDVLLSLGVGKEEEPKFEEPQAEQVEIEECMRAKEEECKAPEPTQRKLKYMIEIAIYEY